MLLLCQHHCCLLLLLLLLPLTPLLLMLPQLWDGSEQDRHALQQFLIKHLGLHFEEELPVPRTPSCSDIGSPQTAAATGAAEGAKQLATQQPPNLTEAQYSIAAFKALLNPAATSAAGAPI
ncbi:hypothetical protein COO60DRAFT_883310 [Scenedesmus sp. NREL 46B-D3]|nr:hypothetical protein COO60DRAFT_883310 [Scenedesmus sp. NREL 46B-D3]